MEVKSNVPNHFCEIRRKVRDFACGIHLFCVSYRVCSPNDFPDEQGTETLNAKPGVGATGPS